MAKKIAKKSIPWLLVSGLTLIVIIILPSLKVMADEAPTSVTVPNAAPTLADEREDPASSSTSPTNAGNNVTFKGTGTDPNNHQYYLALCKTNAITPNSDAPPTCPGGNWCISSATNSGVEASCTYTTLDSDNESNDWYAFACDKVADNPACSSAGQGSGDSGSPFKVNHRPSFTVFQDNSPVDPAGTVTWVTTASDPDIDGTPDTVSLYVCKENDFTGTGCGAGGTWCFVTGQASNPSCQATAPRPDGDWTAYGFVIDNHNFAASGGAQGSDSVLTVNNVSPSISATSINLKDSDDDGYLVPKNEQAETLDFTVEFVVTDNNSCKNITNGNEIASALTHVYRSGIGQSGCDTDGEDNNNYCYANAQAGTGGQCVQDETIDACTGADDVTVGWRCEFPLQYHPDPTVDTNTQYPLQNWLASVQATDDDGSDTGLVEDNDGNEMDKFVAFDLNTASIAYGEVQPDNESAEQTVVLEATGNTGLDAEYSGTNMTSGGNFIAVGQQKYDHTSGKTWANMDYTLTAIAVERELNCPKTTITGSPATKNTYFKLKVPLGQAPGIYSGTDTFTGIEGESADW